MCGRRKLKAAVDTQNPPQNRISPAACFDDPTSSAVRDQRLSDARHTQSFALSQASLHSSVFTPVSGPNSRRLEEGFRAKPQPFEKDSLTACLSVYVRVYVIIVYAMLALDIESVHAGFCHPCHSCHLADQARGVLLDVHYLHF